MASEWPLPLFAYPSDNVTPNAESATCATENTLYPASRLGDLNPATPFKSTTTGAVIVWTFTISRALKAIAAFNHNLAGITAVLTNNNGLTPVNLVFPANGYDNICRNPWTLFDSQSASVRNATVWTLTISGAAALVAIGEIQLLTEVRDLNLIWGLKVKPRHQVSSPGTTFGGSRLKYNKRFLIREVTGRVDLKADEPALKRLEDETVGDLHPWLFIEDEAVNEAMLLQFDPDTFEHGPVNVGISEMPIRATEMASGPSLFA